MKRLKNIFLGMDPNTTTYTDMYEGPIIFVSCDSTGGFDNDNTYFSNSVGYRIERTHKLALDKPTVIIQIPVSLLGISVYSTAAADHCLRMMKPYIDDLNSELYNRKRPDKENGRYCLYEPGPEVMLRNSAFFKECKQKDYINGNGKTVIMSKVSNGKTAEMCLCICMQVQLPGKKLRKAVKMLCSDLPSAVNMFINEFDKDKLENALALAEKQKAIREYLKDSEYCTFIANGSILPRSKNTWLPLKDAVPFVSVPNDEIEICGVRGMGIKRGVTVITGGGYSGKTTLLDAISAGIYDHILGDGRELCITDETAVMISAEEGRSVKSIDISPFIKWIPDGDPKIFSTDHASGSTSQAANIIEAVNSGTSLLLIDEDKSATNFMICDNIMKELIEREPIIPFTDRVNELYKELGVSTILVIGGSSEYLSVADKIYMMDNYKIKDVTERSKYLSENSSRKRTLPAPAKWKHKRTLSADGFTSYPEGIGTERLEINDLGYIFIGDERIDINLLHDLVSSAQAEALGFMLRMLEITNREERIDVSKRVDEIYESILKNGLDIIYSSFFTTCGRFLDLPRKTELIAVINRMRKIGFITEAETY